MFNIVIIDDDNNLINNIKKHVNFSDLNIRLAGSANNGAEGLSIIKQLAPDIVMSDISMPELSGLELLKELGTMHSQPLVILMTGHDNLSYAKEAILNNVFDYLTKPAFPADITASLKRAVAYLSTKNMYPEQEYLHALYTGNETKIQNCLNDFAEKITTLEIYDLKLLKDSVFSFIKAYLSNLKTAVPDTENLSSLMSNIWDCISLLEEKEDLVFFLKNAIETYEPASQSNAEKIAKKAKAYAEREYSDSKISTSSVADHLNISTNYLRTVFKNTYGISLKDYITQIRMEQAKILINEGNHKVYEISYMVGYTNLQLFRKNFKEHFGTSPSKI